MDPTPDSAAPPADDPAEPAGPDGISALIADIRQLASDAKTLAEAELAFQASRAKVAGTAARTIAICGLLAFVLAFFALGGLTIGLLLALTPLVTAWGATAIVVGGLLLAALACILVAAGSWKRTRRALAGSESEPSR
ncbi:phage holin family protein [Novosphingobium bradum]|uniref:Phage holin family protein n=1 Tax=Novosphingobium bradum TaxID=1737444 RepID=A0ABV7INT8_9SPHN